MEVEKAISLADQLRNDFGPRQGPIELCRRHGFQLRKNGSPAFQNDKTDRLSPLNNSIPACLAWRLAMYLHANTLGVGSSFFGLRVEPKDPKKVIPKADLDRVRDATFLVTRKLFNTNFSSETGTALHELAVTGNSATICNYNEDDDCFEFRNYSIGDGAYFGENSRGKRDMFCRYFQFDAKQAKQEFGKDAGPRIEQALQTNDSTANKYVWLVYPRAVFGEKVLPGRGKTVPASKKRFGSVIIDLADRRIVKEGGYDDFPFAIPFWQRRGGSPYGWSGIEMSMPEIVYLADLKHLKRKATKKHVQPPLVVSSLWEGLSTDENAVNFVEGDIKDSFAALPVPTSLEIIERDMLECERIIRMNLMLDAFEALDDQKRYMTAREVDGRVTQSVRAIAPIVSQLHQDYFSPLIKRVFNIMVDRGEIVLPNTVSPEEVVVKYVSVLDTLILQGEASKLQEFVGAMMNLIQARAGLGDLFDCYLDMEAIISQIADCFNVPMSIIRDSKTVKDMLDELRSRMEQIRQDELQAKMIKPIDPQKRAEAGAPMSAMVP